jgi:Na+-transporting methylmalonyl-CoA/oxaloacetate decarboxylase gamma subunit
MKALRLFPLAFLANIDGFALLLAYLILFMTAVWTAQAFATRARLSPVSVGPAVGSEVG